MKKRLLNSVLIFLGLLSINHITRADSSIKFTHKGIQKGAISESCYHNPCSIAKVITFKQLDRTNESSMIELTVLGGHRDWDSKKINWNKKYHKVYVTCSMLNPTVSLGGQVTIIPLNKNGVPGVLASDSELYLKACHNFNGSDTEAAKKFGYHVEEVW